VIDSLGLARSGVWPVLLVPVRITPRKNLELALHVLAVLRADGTDAHLVVTGPADPHARGTDAGVSALRKLADRLGVSAAVHLLAVDRGRRTPTRVVTDLFRVADALLLPSRDEGFGLPVLEAAVSRLPIVCADLPTLREVAGDDASYFDPDADPEHVAELLRRRLEADPAARLAARTRSAYDWGDLRDTDRASCEVAAGAGARTDRDPPGGLSSAAADSGCVTSTTSARSAEQVGRREVEVDAVAPPPIATTGRPTIDASAMTGQAFVEPNGVIV
jgi:hypothetical protein